MKLCTESKSVQRTMGFGKYFHKEHYKLPQMYFFKDKACKWSCIFFLDSKSKLEKGDQIYNSIVSFMSIK